MLTWLLVGIIVVPVLAALYYAYSYKPRPPIRCKECDDGREMEGARVKAQNGFKLALECPACGELYEGKISQLGIKPLAEEDYRKDFS